MNRHKSIIFGSALFAAGVATGSSSAFAQTFQSYRYADGSQSIVGFFDYDSRAHLQIDGGVVTLARRFGLWFALFGRRRHPENLKGRYHGQARQTADDSVRTDMRKRAETFSFRPSYRS
jgi:hypothetical protein